MNDPDAEVRERARRRQYSAKYKLEILEQYDGLNRHDKGAVLRREGLYTSLLSEWREQRDRGALEALDTKPGRPPVDRSSGRTPGYASGCSAWRATWTRPAR